MPGTAYGSPSDQGRLRYRSCTNELFTPAILIEFRHHDHPRIAAVPLKDPRHLLGLEGFQGGTFTGLHPSLRTKVFGIKEGKEVCL
jgi:hypothetical protein